MTDETGRPARATQEGTNHLDDVPPGAGPHRRRGRHPVAGGRIAAAGIGIAAMLGLVANMQVASGRTRSADPAPTVGLSSQPTAKSFRHAGGIGPGRIAAAKVSRPIVLTPHAVVHTVAAPAASGSGGSGYAAAAPAPAAAPVASTSGSH